MVFYCSCLNDELTDVHVILQDMSQETPTQELVAKDLHGCEWKFKHIFRGNEINPDESKMICLIFCHAQASAQTNA